MNDHVNKTMAGILNNAMPKENALPSVTSYALLADALRGVLALLDDGVLVRDISHDDDVMAFMRQGVRITSVLKAAQDALTANKGFRGKVA